MVIKERAGEVIEVELSREELDKLIDREARLALGMSGRDFIQQYDDGNLSEEDPRVRVLVSLLRLAA
jgi:parvulin-like peptidyl-prolyl isomerase